MRIFDLLKHLKKSHPTFRAASLNIYPQGGDGAPRYTLGRLPLSGGLGRRAPQSVAQLGFPLRSAYHWAQLVRINKRDARVTYSDTFAGWS